MKKLLTLMVTSLIFAGAAFAEGQTNDVPASGFCNLSEVKTYATSQSANSGSGASTSTSSSGR